MVKRSPAVPNRMPSRVAWPSAEPPCSPKCERRRGALAHSRVRQRTSSVGPDMSPEPHVIPCHTRAGRPNSGHAEERTDQVRQDRREDRHQRRNELLQETRRRQEPTDIHSLTPRPGRRTPRHPRTGRNHTPPPRCRQPPRRARPTTNRPPPTPTGRVGAPPEPEWRRGASPAHREGPSLLLGFRPGSTPALVVLPYVRSAARRHARGLDEYAPVPRRGGQGDDNSNASRRATCCRAWRSAYDGSRGGRARARGGCRAGAGGIPRGGRHRR